MPDGDSYCCWCSLLLMLPGVIVAVAALLLLLSCGVSPRVFSDLQMILISIFPFLFATNYNSAPSTREMQSWGIQCWVEVELLCYNFPLIPQNRGGVVGRLTKKGEINSKLHFSILLYISERTSKSHRKI